MTASDINSFFKTVFCFLAGGREGEHVGAEKVWGSVEVFVCLKM